jgi:hypothetical protein
MAPNYINPTTTIILYEKLDVSIVELETKRSLKVVWTGIHNKEEATHPFLLPKTSMVNDLADHISKLVTLTPTGSQKIRVFEISKDGKTQKEFTGTEMIGNIPEPVELYAEVRGGLVSWVVLNVFCVCRRFRLRSLRRTIWTRSSACSISRKTCRGHTVFLSNSWSSV